MKKGAISSIIGLGIFYFVFSRILSSESSVFSAIPTFFIIMFIGGIVSYIKKAAKNESGKSQVHRNNDMDSQEINSFESTSETNKSNNNSSYKDAYQEQKSSFSKRCKDCNSLISSDDSYCPECGASQKDTIICEYCGHENPSTSALCDKCNGFI